MNRGWVPTRLVGDKCTLAWVGWTLVGLVDTEHWCHIMAPQPLHNNCVGWTNDDCLMLSFNWEPTLLGDCCFEKGTRSTAVTGVLCGFLICKRAREREYSVRLHPQAFVLSRQAMLNTWRCTEVGPSNADDTPMVHQWFTNTPMVHQCNAHRGTAAIYI